jgi:hypothetical protein
MRRRRTVGRLAKRGLLMCARRQAAQPLRSMGLTASHKRIIFGHIGTEQAQTVPNNAELSVGRTIPESLMLNSMPIAAKDQIGLLKDFKFVKVADDKILLVDPATRLVFAGVQTCANICERDVVPRGGMPQPNENNNLEFGGTFKSSTGSFGFLPRVSHQDTTRENRSPDCASTLTLIITPAPRSAGRYEAHLDGEDHVWCVSRMPFLDAARALIAAGHDANAILEMYRLGASSWDLRAPLLVAAQLDVAETPFGPKFVRRRWPIEACVDCNRSTARARPTPLGN